MYPVVMAADITAEIPDEPGIRAAKTHFSDYVNRVIYRGDVVWIRKNDRCVAALVPVQFVERAERDAALLAHLAASHPELHASLLAAVPAVSVPLKLASD